MSEYIELEFRSGRIGYYINTENLEITPDSWLILGVEKGLDIAQVINTAFHVEKPENEPETPPEQQFDYMKIIRVATEEDLGKLDELITSEEEATDKFMAAVVKYPFEMQLVDTIYQFDKNKLTFFFTADGRVDFREFVRELASMFKTRIELHQISGRDVARRLGGMGMCGYRYCCTSFLRRFNQITIKMVKDQNLSGNLSKISGPCGRLLCCLDYEQDFYQETAKDFPEIGEEVYVNKDIMIVSKNDYYSKKITLVSEDDSIEIIPLEEFNKLKKVSHRKPRPANEEPNPRNSNTDSRNARPAEKECNGSSQSNAGCNCQNCENGKKE